MQELQEFVKKHWKVIAAGIAVLVIVIALAGCGKSEAVGFNTLEQARDQARANALENAQRFRAADPRFEGLDIISRGDSTQTAECPQGDGWASIDFNPKGTQTLIGAKCSTVSRSLGCMTSEDFKKRDQYASKENKCDESLPFPIPKLQN